MAGRDGAPRRPHRRSAAEATERMLMNRALVPNRSALADSGGDIAARCPYQTATGQASSQGLVKASQAIAKCDKMNQAFQQQELAMYSVKIESSPVKPYFWWPGSRCEPWIQRHDFPPTNGSSSRWPKADRPRLPIPHRRDEMTKSHFLPDLKCIYPGFKTWLLPAKVTSVQINRP